MRFVPGGLFPRSRWSISCFEGFDPDKSDLFGPVLNTKRDAEEYIVIHGTDADCYQVNHLLQFKFQASGKPISPVLQTMILHNTKYHHMPNNVPNNIPNHHMRNQPQTTPPPPPRRHFLLATHITLRYITQPTIVCSIMQNKGWQNRYKFP